MRRPQRLENERARQARAVTARQRCNERGFLDIEYRHRTILRSTEHGFYDHGTFSSISSPLWQIAYSKAITDKRPRRMTGDLILDMILVAAGVFGVAVLVGRWLERRRG
jgi:hypothetical protein